MENLNEPAFNGWLGERSDFSPVREADAPNLFIRLKQSGL